MAILNPRKWCCEILGIYSKTLFLSILLLLLSSEGFVSTLVGVTSQRRQDEEKGQHVDQSYLMPAPTVRVYLFSFERGFLLQITDVPNTDVILTKAPGYFEAYMFECNASYPVQWVYLGDGAPIVTGDVGRAFQDFFDPGTYAYHAGMIMYKLYEQNSGRYVCRGIESLTQRLSASLHLYVPGNDVLISTAEKTVQVAPYKDQITLPCGISDPTQADQVNLFKGNHKGAYKRVETNSSIVFNPRKGFRLQKQQLQDVFGKYLCVAARSKKRARIQVIPKVETKVKRQVLSNDIYGISSALQFSYDARYHRMLCCASSRVAPKLFFAGCTSVVDCELKSACFRENKCERREGELTDNGYYNHYIGLDPEGCTGYSLRTDPNGDFGLLLCTDLFNSATQYQPFLLNRGNLFMSFDQAPTAEKVMTLDRATQEELFVGSETMFRCNSSRFFFGFGVRWAFERLDGDLEFIEDSEVIRDVYFVNNHRRHSVLRIPHANIKSVICVAPVWNSPTEWRILSFPISVSRVFHPPPQSFESSGEETGPYQSSETVTEDKQLQQRFLQSPPTSASRPQGPAPFTTFPPSQQAYLAAPQQSFLVSPPPSPPPAVNTKLYASPQQVNHQPYLSYNPRTTSLRDFEIIPAVNRLINHSPAGSSNQYFYTNTRYIERRRGGPPHPDYEQVFSPKSALQILNTTFDLSSIL